MNEKIKDKSVLEALEQQEDAAIDGDGMRWIRCRICGKVAPVKYFWTYGGIGEVNQGKCYDCIKPKVNQVIYFIKGPRIYRGVVKSLFVKNMPSCFEVLAKDGMHYTGAWAESKEIATQRLQSYWAGEIEYID